jgi:hypothetical protein
MTQEWDDTKERMLRRTFRVLEVLQILIFDAVVIACGDGLILIGESLPGSESRFFQAAKVLSGGAFLVIYIVWVIYDLREFFSEAYHSRSPGAAI